MNNYIELFDMISIDAQFIIDEMTDMISHFVIAKESLFLSTKSTSRLMFNHDTNLFINDLFIIIEKETFSNIDILQTHIFVDEESFFVVEILRSLIANQQIVIAKATILTITSSIVVNQNNAFVDVDVTISEDVDVTTSDVVDVTTFDIVDATTSDTVDATTFDTVDTSTSVITQNTVVNQMIVTSTARKKSINTITNAKKTKFTRPFSKAKSQKLITKNMFYKKKIS